MKWTPEDARWAIQQLDACGNAHRAIHECDVTLQSLGPYRLRVCEHARRWFVSLAQATPDVYAARIAKVRSIAESGGSQ